MFQFHAGSIKGRECELQAVTPCNVFQFHAGSIKGKVLEKPWRGGYKFQFHAGSIKGMLKMRSCGQVTSFNSTLVRLKACGVAVNSANHVLVSIPRWFD